MGQTVIEHIDSVFHLLNAQGISACVIGELALNYYNVPRVVHDLEICVHRDDLNRASTILRSHRELFEPANEDVFNVYTEYRRGMPRFRFRASSTANVVLFPDELLGSEGLIDNIVPQSLHQQHSEYSFELLDLIPEDRITSLPFPFLGPLLSSCSRKYTSSQDVIPAMAVDGLVDGMDLDESWCERNLINIEPKSLEHVLSRVRSRSSRIDYFSPNTITCIIANSEERERLLNVPGREISPFPCNTAGRNRVRRLWNMATDVCSGLGTETVLRFLERQKQNLPHTL